MAGQHTKGLKATTWTFYSTFKRHGNPTLSIASYMSFPCNTNCYLEYDICIACVSLNKQSLLFHPVVFLLSLMCMSQISAVKLMLLLNGLLGYYCIVNCIFVVSHETRKACQGHNTQKCNII